MNEAKIAPNWRTQLLKHSAFKEGIRRQTRRLARRLGRLQPLNLAMAQRDALSEFRRRQGIDIFADRMRRWIFPRRGERRLPVGPRHPPLLSACGLGRDKAAA